jgi:hypothetical protein
MTSSEALHWMIVGGLLLAGIAIVAAAAGVS